MQVSTIGLDLAKRVFHVHGVDAAGAVVVCKRLRRSEVLRFFAKLSPCLVGMEACASAHYWARELVALGHEVRLLPPSYVKPYVKRGKNDAVDAAAICEAVTRPSMRFVAVKSAEQQSVLMLHRVRDLLMRQRTMAINALRAHLAELGIVAARGRASVKRLVAGLEDGRLQGVPELARMVLGQLAGQLRDVERRVEMVEREIVAWHRANADSRRLEAIGGFGPINASALVATVSDARQFQSGRHMAAWLGIPPKQKFHRRQNPAGTHVQAGRSLFAAASGAWSHVGDGSSPGP